MKLYKIFNAESCEAKDVDGEAGLRYRFRHRRFMLWHEFITSTEPPILSSALSSRSPNELVQSMRLPSLSSVKSSLPVLLLLVLRRFLFFLLPRLLHHFSISKDLVYMHIPYRWINIVVKVGLASNTCWMQIRWADDDEDNINSKVRPSNRGPRRMPL